MVVQSDEDYCTRLLVRYECWSLLLGLSRPAVSLAGARGKIVK